MLGFNEGNEDAGEESMVMLVDQADYARILPVKVED